MSEPAWPTVVFTSRKLLRIARKAANRSRKETDQALVALVFSAAAVEGFINDVMELSTFVKDDNPQAVSLRTLLQEAEAQRAQVGLKLQIISSVCRNAPIPRGDLLYQDFDLLFRIRNSLVHVQPVRARWGWLDDETARKPHSADRLIGRLIPQEHASRAGTWLELISRPEVAGWACDTAFSIAQFIFSMVSEDPLKRLLWTAWAPRNESVSGVSLLGPGFWMYKKNDI